MARMNMSGICKNYFHVNSILLKSSHPNKDMYTSINIFEITDILDEGTAVVIQQTSVNSFSR